jgi:SMI1 / KNR4 family (SUKH-1)
MRDLSELNMNQGGKPVTRAPPSEDEIQTFETEFNAVLPEDYVAFLNHSNGGHPELDSVQPEGQNDHPARGVDHFYFLSSDRVSPQALWRGATAWRKLLGNSFVAFAEDAGGNPFLFDLSTDPLAVCTCLHDDELAIVKVSSSFGAFIDALEFDPDMV